MNDEKTTNSSTIYMENCEDMTVQNIQSKGMDYAVVAKNVKRTKVEDVTYYIDETILDNDHIGGEEINGD